PPAGARPGGRVRRCHGPEHRRPGPDRDRAAQRSARRVSVDRTGSRTQQRRSEATTTTATLTNARARIVGDRTGVLADAIVAIVRGAGAAQEIAGQLLRRVTSVVTALGWVVLLVVPLALGFG